MSGASAAPIAKPADLSVRAENVLKELALELEAKGYGWLEETVDACKDVAQVISEIVIKGS